MRRLRGQSLVEFAAGAAAMSLLLLGTILLGGYQEVDRRGLFAARQQAHEGSWLAGRTAGDPRAQMLHAMHLADPGVSGPFDGRQYVARDGVEITQATGAAGGVAADAAMAMLTPLQAAGGFLNSSFDLANDGLVRGQVRLHLPPPAGAPGPFSGLDLQLTATYALLGDAWHAAGPGHVTGRASGLVPGSALAGFTQLWQPLLAPIRLLEPSFGKLCLGMVEAERVPEDRLGRGYSPLPGACP